ncbi:MAG: hypothetical protein K5880_06025 [Hydrogenophaga sp.]|jgi:hypothetical protein|uniref:hypothetical protein n=1 Tax=Hydrogenophaga sp. TaxID=1904254 RepID=UPI00260ADAAB|nr:hypothetical protein [Hydrogenophaga sp.]MCV0438167.1 hypothetical protein [Hydrogenophaga sp.]
MNRCTTSTPSRARKTAATLSAMLCLGFFSAGTAQAQAVQRNFPDKALRGEMVVVQPPLVAMDDRPTRLSPGARILDTSNRLVRSATLVNKELVVNYTMDHRGQVHQVWILTEAEAKEKRPGYGTQRNFTFESQQATPAATTSN